MQPVRRGKGRPFQKGQSGNPGGKAKIPADVIEAAKAHTTDAIATLASVMNNISESGASRVSAATALLDRAWGKAHQTSTVNVNRSPSQMARDELDALIAGLAAREETAPRHKGVTH